MAERAKRVIMLTRYTCGRCYGEGDIHDADFSEGDSDQQMYLRQDTLRTCPICSGRGFVNLRQCSELVEKHTILQTEIARVQTKMRYVAGEMLQNLRATLTIRQIARRLKRSPDYVTKVMGGQTIVSPEVFSAIVQVCLENGKEDVPTKNE